MAFQTVPGAYLFVLDVSDQDLETTKSIIKRVSRRTRVMSNTGSQDQTFLLMADTEEDATMVRMAVFDQIVSEERMTRIVRP